VDAPLDELYFNWLYGQVGSLAEKNPSRTYWRMLKQLYTKEFVWIIQNDDNRAIDGQDLRREFIDQEGLSNVDLNWMRLGCSMFELLIGLSRRLSFEDGGEPTVWFWHLIENLGLEQYNDNTRVPEEKIDDILNRVIFRTYDRKGRGGLFPMNKTREDQREVELWYQLNEYLIEHSY
jgi:hypothetical protein